MNKLHTLYQELYNAANSESGYRLNKQKVYFHQLSHFAGMKGGYYDEQKVKLLIVGRAVNGWGNFSANTTQEFASQAISAMETKCFDWVEFDDCGALRNNKKDDKGKWYWLSKSPFWRVSRQIWASLTNNHDFVDTPNNRWVDYIAWTNLYKIAPTKEGNPTATMCKRQLEVCKNILKAEIEQYKPTHILFITGYDYWFSDFEDTFPFCDQTKPSSDYSYVEKVFREHEQSIIIACRPEGKNEEEYISQVLSAFKNLSDK